MSKAWLLASVAVTMAACGSSTDDRPVSWRYIATAIIEPNCATSSCHSSLTRADDVQLDTRDTAYTTLVGTGGFVVPGQPDQSMLMYLLRGEQTWRMPPDQPLPDADILLIERWILDGAQDN